MCTIKYVMANGVLFIINYYFFQKIIIIVFVII